MNISYLVKVSNNLVEQPQALHALVVPVQLHVELVVVGNGGEDHADALVRLVVQVLPTAPLASAKRARADKSGWGGDSFILLCLL